MRELYVVALERFPDGWVATKASIKSFPNTNSTAI